MRRMVGILALLGGLLMATAAPASAHPAIEDPYVPIRATTTVTFGVPSEEPGAMVEVDLTLPPDFLQRLDPSPGWNSVANGHQVGFSGGDVPQGGFAQFTFAGIFAAKRVVELPVVTRSNQGLVRNWVGGDHSPALVGGSSTAGPGRRSRLELAAGVVVGLVAVAALVVRRRRLPTAVSGA